MSPMSRGIILLARLFGWLLCRLPKSVTQILAKALSFLWFRLIPIRRRVALENLQRAMGERYSTKERQRIARSMMAHLAHNYMEFMEIPFLGDDALISSFRWNGLEHLERLKEAGEGALILTAHLGAFDLLACATAKMGYPLTIISRSTRSRVALELWMGYRKSCGIKILPEKGSLKELLRALKRGAFVVMVLDQNMNRDRGLFVRFFGRPACTLDSVAVLARRTGVPVLPVFTHRAEDGAHEVEVGERLELSQSGNQQEDILRDTQRFTELIEAQVRAHPEQWLWLHRRWKTQPEVADQVTSLQDFVSDSDPEQLPNADSIEPFSLAGGVPPRRSELSWSGGRPMRVVHVNTECGWRGGEAQLLHLARGQAARGLEPVVVCQPASPLEAALQNAGIRTSSLKMRGEWDLLAAARIRRVARAHRADILHLHTPHAHALGWLASIGAPFSLVVHRRVDFPLSRNPLSILKYRCRIEHFVAVSRAVRDVLVEAGVSSAKVRVIHSAVPPLEPLTAEERSAYRSSFDLSEEELVIGTVASLVEHKGLVYLLEAVAKLTPGVGAGGVRGRAVRGGEQSKSGAEETPLRAIKLLVVGDGKLRSQLEAHARVLGISDRCRWLGFREDARRILRIFDVFVAPSILEGLNTSAIDAQLAGIPLVASTAGGLGEVVDRDSGWPVPPRASEAIAQAILEIQDAPALTDEKVARARVRAETHFALPRMLEETEKVYQEVLIRGCYGKRPGESGS